MVTATLPKPKPQTREKSISTACPRCGGRLFLDMEFHGRRLFYFLSCINCSREYRLSGVPVPRVW